MKGESFREDYVFDLILGNYNRCSFIFTSFYMQELNITIYRQRKLSFLLNYFYFKFLSDHSDFFGFIVVNLGSICLRIVEIYVSKLTI